MKEIPIGVDDFKKIRDEGGYYVDKSALVDRILSRRLTGVFLYTRPRRFGKTLNLSMLDAYLNMTYAGDWDRFSDLEISRIRPDDPDKNSNVVVNLSLKDLGDGSYDVFIELLEDRIRTLYAGYPELRCSDRIGDVNREYLDLVLGGGMGPVKLMLGLSKLTSMLSLHHGRKVIVLIDEYDNVMNVAHGSPEDYERISSFFRVFLGSALKTNQSLRFAVLTGVMKIAKESIFSGLNNLDVSDVLDPGSDESYGFTADEVEELCSYYGHPEKYPEARKWYDGYRFGDTEIYNPWSVLKYVKSGFVPDAYWAGTSGNMILDELVGRTDSDTWSNLQALCSGDRLNVQIDRNIVYRDLESTPDAIYSVMVMSGYLNAVRSDYGFMVSIPNLEMITVFRNTVIRRFGNGLNKVVIGFIDDMKRGDVEKMTDDLRNLMEMLSVRILNNEFPYEAFITGLVAVEGGRYEILADHEAGNGYYDIRMRSIAGHDPNICVEIKHVKESMSPDSLAGSALKQIRDRDYVRGLRGRTLLYGIAFGGKDPTIVMDAVG